MRPRIRTSQAIRATIRLSGCRGTDTFHGMDWRAKPLSNGNPFWVACNRSLVGDSNGSRVLIGARWQHQRRQTARTERSTSAPDFPNSKIYVARCSRLSPRHLRLPPRSTRSNRDAENHHHRGLPGWIARTIHEPLRRRVFRDDGI